MSHSDPVVLRGLRAFEGPLAPRMVPLRDEFERAWRAFVDHLRERVVLLSAFWSADDHELLAALLPRIVWLGERIEAETRAMHAAVDLGEAQRIAGPFFRVEGLSPRSTLAAINAATMSDEPLSRSRLRRDRGAA